MGMYEPSACRMRDNLSLAQLIGHRARVVTLPDAEEVGYLGGGGGGDH
jgi:RNase P/RNase MRP subunit p29